MCMLQCSLVKSLDSTGNRNEMLALFLKTIDMLRLYASYQHFYNLYHITLTRVDELTSMLREGAKDAGNVTARRDGYIFNILKL